MRFLKKIRLLGLRYFLENVVYKVSYKLSLTKSKTVFLSINLDDIVTEIVLPNADLKVKKLTSRYIKSLEEILIFSDALVDDFFYNDKKGAFIVINKEDEVVAFSFYDLSEQHIVNGWASVDMAKDMAWIGPVFVHPKYRGNKLNKALYYSIFNIFEGQRFNFLTCINSNNHASIKSHEAMGFISIGEIIRSNKHPAEINCYKSEFKNIVKLL